MDDPLAHLLDAGLELSRDERYLIERELGRGSMGVVYAARDVLLDRPVALKVMASAAADDVELRRCFEREARAAARLAHRNVVTVHDSGFDAGGAPFVVMELLRGRDLRELLAAGDPLPLERRLAIVLQVLAGLAHAHASGVVHRDVKPANVFITEQGVVKLLDFGIARLTRTSTAGSSDAVTGTADYMSPEQVLGGPVDGRSDLFSCGAVLFELLAGRPPFHAESRVTVAYRVVHEQPEYESLPPACRSLGPVLQKALAKSRDERYPSAPDFATDIALATGVGVAPETIEPAPAWTLPLPRLRRLPPPTVRMRQPRKQSVVGLSGLPAVRPRWPMQAAGEDDEPPQRALARGRRGRAMWAAAAAAAAITFAVGIERWRGGPRTPPGAVMTVAAAEPEPERVLHFPQAPPPTAAPPPIVGTPAAPPATEPTVQAIPVAQPTPARPLPAQATSLWNAAPAPAGTPAPEPAVTPPPAPPVEEPPSIVAGRWTGFVTDDLCRDRGAVSDHGQCLEACLRRGRRPLISIDGQLYRLIGLERIRGLNDRRVVVEGRLDLQRRALTVAAGWPAP